MGAVLDHRSVLVPELAEHFYIILVVTKIIKQNFPGRFNPASIHNCRGVDNYLRRIREL